MKDWKKNFFTIWGGQAFSLLTSAILQFAIVWYITQKTNSAATLSIAMIAAFLPQGILGIFIGVFIDRLNRKTIMIISDLVIAGVGLALAAVAIMAEVPIWFIFVVLALRSVGAAFHSPSLSAVTPLIVPQDKLIKCAGYTQTLMSVSYILSSAIGAALYAVWPLWAIIFLDVLGAVVASITVGIAQIPKIDKKQEKLQVFKEIKEGIGALKEHKGIVALLVIGSLYMLFLMPVSALFPLMTLSHFNGTTIQVGVVEVIYAVGMFVGGIILGVWGGLKNKVIVIALSIIIMGIAVTISGTLGATMLIVFIVLSGIMGISTPFYSGVQMAIVQEKIKPEYLGRVFFFDRKHINVSNTFGVSVFRCFWRCCGG